MSSKPEVSPERATLDSVKADAPVGPRHETAPAVCRVTVFRAGGLHGPAGAVGYLAESTLPDGRCLKARPVNTVDEATFNRAGAIRRVGRRASWQKGDSAAVTRCAIRPEHETASVEPHRCDPVYPDALASSPAATLATSALPPVRAEVRTTVTYSGRVGAEFRTILPITGACSPAVIRHPLDALYSFAKAITLVARWYQRMTDPSQGAPDDRTVTAHTYDVPSGASKAHREGTATVLRYVEPDASRVVPETRTVASLRPDDPRAPRVRPAVVRQRLESAVVRAIVQPCEVCGRWCSHARHPERCPCPNASRLAPSRPLPVASTGRVWSTVAHVPSEGARRRFVQRTVTPYTDVQPTPVAPLAAIPSPPVAEVRGTVVSVCGWCGEYHGPGTPHPGYGVRVSPDGEHFGAVPHPELSPGAIVAPIPAHLRGVNGYRPAPLPAFSHPVYTGTEHATYLAGRLSAAVEHPSTPDTVLVSRAIDALVACFRLT